MQFRLILLLLMAVPVVVLATPRQEPVDSVRALLRRPHLPDTQRVQLLDELCWLLNRTDLTQARRAGEKGLQLARRIGYRLGEARLLNDLGTAVFYAGDNLTAQRYYAEGIPLARRTGPPRLLGHLLMGLGNVAADQNENDRAVTFYGEASAAYAANKPPALADRALVLHNIGTCYQNWGRLPEAARALRQALQLMFQLGDSATAANVLVSLALVRTHAAPDSAILILRQAIRMAHTTHNRLTEVLAINTLGRVLLNEKKQPGPALKLLQQGAQLARQLQSDDHLARALGPMADALRQQGRVVAAFDTLRAYQELRDTLANRSRIEAMAQQQVRFEVAQQQLRIRTLDQQRRLALQAAERQQLLKHVLALVVLALTVGLLAFAFNFYRLRGSRRLLAQSESALLASNRTKDQLMSIVGHDLRGPVAAFQQVGGMLRYYIRQADTAGLAAVADELERGATNLATLLDNLLHWTRAQIGEVVNHPTVVPPASSISTVLNLHQQAARAKQQTLATELPPGLPGAWVDPLLLDTVLRNLVSNAIKFTPSGGTITVGAQATHRGIEFSVRDTGHGLTLTEVNALFAPAVRSTKGTAGEVGTGLGVAVCRQFVKLLGGELRVASAPGQGARFWFAVPMMPARAVPFS